MMDGTSWDNIPDDWNNINFGEIDVLILAPLGLQDPQTGAFGVLPALEKRFHWAIAQAKAAPRLIPGTTIKILVSQFWGKPHEGWGYTLTALPSSEVDAYAQSVRKFLVQYDLDGYDIDYEQHNIEPTIPAILATIRAQLDALSQATGGRPYYTTVSPAYTNYLAQAAGSLSGLNMQSYSGGSAITVEQLLGMGFEADQLLYGVNAESPDQGPTVEEALAAYRDNKLVGIHVWRVGNAQENAWQDQIYRGLHGV